MSDGGFSECAMPDDYESPVNELDRLRKEVPVLKEQIKQLEDQIRELNQESKWSDDIPNDCDFTWVKAKGNDEKTIGYIDREKNQLVSFSEENINVTPLIYLKGVGLEFRKVK